MRTEPRPDRDFNIADLHDDPNGEGLAIAAIFAAQGYIVVAPNYAGYDVSTLAYHPYLVADQQSKDMIDALTAARSALPTAPAPTTTDSGSFSSPATRRAVTWRWRRIVPCRPRG